jgi:hypothetical protein
MEAAQDLTQCQVWISVMLTHHSWGELRVTFCNQDVHNHVKEVLCSLPSLFCGRHTGSGQNKGNSCERYTFLYLYKVEPLFACYTACILGTDSSQFCIVSSGIVYHSSWTSSSCFRDGGTNLLLTPHCKADRSGSMMFKSGDCVCPVKILSVTSCSSNQDWKLLAACTGKSSS